MLEKKLGKTGLVLPAIGFGGMRFGKIDNRKECVEMCLHAYEKGIRYFDTAPGYFGGKSEEVFGEALSDKDIILSTKSSNSQASGIRKDLEASLKRLKRSKISIFHIWWVLTLQAFEERRMGGAIAEALKMKKEGLFDHLFISTHMGGDEIIQVLDTGYFEGMTLGYSAFDFPYRESSIDYALKKNIAVVAMNPLGGGLIPKNPDIFSVLKRKRDKSLIEGAIRFNLMHPGLSIALVGMEKMNHIDEALAAIDPFIPWSESEIKNLRSTIADKYKGLCSGCGYCQDCPAGLAPAKYMLAYNQRVLGNEMKSVASALQWDYLIPQSDYDKCQECGLCESKCTQHLPIMERMKEIGKLKSAG